MLKEGGGVIPRDDRPDAIAIRVGPDDKPKQDVDNVHCPDSLQMMMR
jgi:hypothetical protein